MRLSPNRPHFGKHTLRSWMLIIVCFIVASACSVPFLSAIPTPTTSASASATQLPATIPATSSPPPTASPTIEFLDQDVLEEMDEIEYQVIQLRGLRPTSPTHRRLLTESELQQEVLQELLQEYSPQEAEDEARVLALFGLLEPGYDLWALYQDLYSEQVLGFYDDASQQMSILSDADFDILERLTYAHEYTHALQDQTYDFQDALNFDDEACEANGDRCIAIQSLLEGDAMLLQSQWLRTYASMADIAGLYDLNAALESPVFSAAPEFIQQSMMFPYEQGVSFVLRFFRQGLWAAVDDVYRNPPASTEQILHPTRYPDDVPIILELPDLENALPGEWREIGRSTLGEWQLMMMLSQFLPDTTASYVADGWGGDSYAAFHDDTRDRSAIVLITAWDTSSDATQYFNTMRNYGDGRFSNATFSWEFMSWETDAIYASLVRSSRQVMWILAPDSATERALRAAISFPVLQR